MLLIAGLLVKGAFGIMIIERENARKAEALEAAAERLALHEAALNQAIAKLQTEEGVIEAIKEKFSATRAGEYVAVIIDERAKATSTGQEGKVWYWKLWDAIISPR